MKRFGKAVWCALLCAVFTAAALWSAWGRESGGEQLWEAPARTLRFVYTDEAEKLQGAEGAPKYGDVFRPYLGPSIELWPALERMYYGRCFSEVELAGLSLCEGSGSYLFWDEENRRVAADSVSYCWANGTYNDGSPLAPCDGGSTLTLTAAKSGILRCWVWMAQEQTFSWHDSDTVLTVYEDTVGYDYDENGEPRRSFVRYRAQFTVDGIEFEVVADAVEQAVFESAVRQVMWGG